MCVCVCVCEREREREREGKRERECVNSNAMIEVWPDVLARTVYVCVC